MNLSRAQKKTWLSVPKIHLNASTLFFVIILSALIAFEIFNYSTTDFALKDLLGELKFAGIHWATILAIAFCGIDFAGISKLFLPQQDLEEGNEVWYLFGAWLLAATMNALLTWWGVSMAIANHSLQSASVMEPQTMLKIVPIFVALMVWVIRILIIGTLSVTGERFSKRKKAQQSSQNRRNPARSSRNNGNSSSHSSPIAPAFTSQVSFTAAGKEPKMTPRTKPGSRPEPTYQSMNPGSGSNSQSSHGNGASF
ncbi:MAG: hypothetical protein JEZ06_00695 [Anaerolineaceae bacterium]|nr:hypothetical protein [Anaerolineaceae bacterium]